MMDILDLKMGKGTSEISNPSSLIRPLLNSTSRNNATDSELLPEPVRPTIPASTKHNSNVSKNHSPCSKTHFQSNTYQFFRLIKH